MITSANVLLIAPELTGITSSQWTQILAQVYLELNAIVWSDYLDVGATWLAAHVATLTTRKGIPGPISSRKVGEVSASYATIVKGPYATTSYGIEFERLLMGRPAARFAVG